MAVTAVSSPQSATTQAVPSRPPQEAETRKPEAAKPADDGARARQAQEQKPEPAKPVVNIEGQKTGQIISVTA
jgi:hypothetical protein